MSKGKNVEKGEITDMIEIFLYSLVKSNTKIKEVNICMLENMILS